MHRSEILGLLKKISWNAGIFFKKLSIIYITDSVHSKSGNSLHTKSTYESRSIWLQDQTQGTEIVRVVQLHSRWRYDFKENMISLPPPAPHSDGDDVNKEQILW